MTATRSDRIVLQVDIASGTSLSGEVNVGPHRIVGVQMPAGWDAAGITFQALVRDGTFGNVHDQAGTEVAITSPAADRYVAIADTVALLGLGRVKVRSGTGATPVNQTANRTLYLILRT